MPSIFRKLVGLPRRLLCLPRRSDVDLADSLTITVNDASNKAEGKTFNTLVNRGDAVAVANRPETEGIVTQKTGIPEDVADVSSSGDMLDEIAVPGNAIIVRRSGASIPCSEDDREETSLPEAFTFSTQRAIPARSQSTRPAAPRFEGRTTDKGTKGAIRELSQLAVSSPTTFVNTWRTHMEETCPTDGRQDPHLMFLILMDVCAINSSFVPESAKSEDLWSNMMLSGVADACMAYLKKYPIARMRMVTGLSNVIICLHTACGPPQDVNAARASFMPLFAQYWKSLWQNRRLLREDDAKGPGESASRARLAVHAVISLFFSVLWRNSAHYSHWIHADFVVFRRVMVLVWMHSVDDIMDAEEKESYPVLDSTLFSKFEDITHFSEDDHRAFVESDIVGEYGAQKYLARACSTYRAFKDVETLAKVHDVMAKIVAHPDFHPHLVSSGILKAIRDTADAPVAQSSNKNALWVLHKAILAAYCRILNSAPIHQAAKPLLRTYDIFELIARASISFVSVQDTERYNCFCTVREVLAVYTVISGGAQAHSKKDGLVNTILQSLRPHWYRTIRDLRRISEYNVAAVPRCERVIDVWKVLGATLGLKEDEEKVEFEKEMKRLEKLCAWKECQYHTTEPPTAANRCMGCREVRYCSRPCQQKDWKEGGHKLRCRRLKAEPHSPRSRQGSSSM